VALTEESGDDRKDAPSPQPGFDLRHWSMQIVLISPETKQEIAADCIQRVKYKLHPSFGPKEVQGTSVRPCKISCEGRVGKIVGTKTLTR
jgi:transcription initiation factor IIF auxiliary subunit